MPGTQHPSLRSARILCITTLALLCTGMVVLASASLAMAPTGDPLYYAKRQGLWLIVGLPAALGFSRVPYIVWRKAAIPLLLVSVALLVAVLFAKPTGGAKRWIHFAGISVQPSELAKFSLLSFLAYWAAKRPLRMHRFRDGIAWPGAAIGVVLILVLWAPDLGMTLLLAITCGVLLVLSGASLSYLARIGAVAAGLLVLFVYSSPMHLGRIRAWIHPEADPGGLGYQYLTGKAAIELGGTDIRLGRGIIKEVLPAAHTDWILAVAGEEGGLLVTGGICALFVILYIAGMRIALLSEDSYGRMLGFGITHVITFQALINVGVVTGALPPTGMPLPLISAGGSNLVTTLCMLGILVNIARETAWSNAATEP